jgi:hypothetical protein
MFVKAAPGLKVPQENKPRDYIDDSVIVPVEASAYNLRRISDGDLVEVSEAEYNAQQTDITKREAAAAKAAAKALNNQGAA